MTLRARFGRELDRLAPVAPGDRVLAAFSGGPDSTALLLLLADACRERGATLAAAHLDHGLDAGAAARAAAAVELAAAVGVPCAIGRAPVGSLRRTGESLEAAARRVRYAFLEERRRGLGARWVATGHHRDDQVETVLLRLLAGSGPEGLAGIAERLGPVVRPLLAVRREELAHHVAAAGLAPLDDPTNRDPARPRNRLRHRLLPALLAAEPDLEARVLAVAAAAAGARRRLAERLAERLAPLPLPGGAEMPVAALRALPPALRPFGLALLHRAAGAAYPPPTAAGAELLRRLLADRRGGCDAGGGWRWQLGGERLRLLAAARPPAAPFAYTLRVPGEVHIPELALLFRLHREPRKDWMFAGSSQRTGLALPIVEGDQVVVRSRRPGDRIQPLGAAGRRRLKEVLIDRRVPRDERDRLPLLVVDGRLAWVPGTTIDESFRVRNESHPWVAELTPAPPARRAMP